jgi:hypothetical protein
MLAWIILQVPLALFPAPALPACQLEVLPPFALEERVLRDFNERVDHYVRVHRRLERALPPEHLFGDLEDMPEAVDALHVAIVGTRPQAYVGSIFSPAVADLLKTRLERAIANSGLPPAGVFVALNLGDREAIPEPQINGHFPAMRYVRVWPALLAALPELPEELQFHFVGRDLVLVDIHADLVVDILKDALPAPHDGLARDPAPLRKHPLRVRPETE